MSTINIFFLCDIQTIVLKLSHTTSVPKYNIYFRMEGVLFITISVCYSCVFPITTFSNACAPNEVYCAFFHVSHQIHALDFFFKIFLWHLMSLTFQSFFFQKIQEISLRNTQIQKQKKNIIDECEFYKIPLYKRFYPKISLSLGFRPSRAVKCTIHPITLNICMLM